MISKESATDTAKNWLAARKAMYEGRKVSVSVSGDRYKVIFHLPEGWLGGDFTVIVDANTGSVLKGILER